MGAPMPLASAGGGLVTDDEVRGPRVDPRPRHADAGFHRTQPGIELIALDTSRLLTRTRSFIGFDWPLFRK